jgi:UDP-3-O-[3-hydroxymyristoyl] glucosamine N-acyltransferase
MQYSVKNISGKYDFCVCGASYAGNPRNNTMMYITKKVEHLISNLAEKKECLVFVEKGINVPDEMKKNNCFISSSNPQYEYAKFAGLFSSEQRRIEQEEGYSLTDGGYYIGTNVVIGNNAYIEPGVLIGHNVTIGNNAIIHAGTVIKHANIGDNFICNENSAIGVYSFTMAEDENGNKFRIPSLGRVIIGNDVEVGACSDIEIGACGDTILEDYVKIAGVVHVGHEAHLKRNTEITAGAIIAGFVELDEHTYLGVNSTIRNRIHLGANCIVGMGANVTKSVEANVTVAGNPAKILERKN